MERIGIDTHGYDEPRELPESPDDEPEPVCHFIIGPLGKSTQINDERFPELSQAKEAAILLSMHYSEAVGLWNDDSGELLALVYDQDIFTREGAKL